MKVCDEKRHFNEYCKSNLSQEMLHISRKNEDNATKKKKKKTRGGVGINIGRSPTFL